MGNELIDHIAKLHTTPMGEERIRRNLSLADADIIRWCRLRILEEKADISRKGKNWYIKADGCRITVNASSYTLITAHRINE